MGGFITFVKTLDNFKNCNMTKEQLIEISKVGFPDRVKQFIDFDNCEIHYQHGGFSLYENNPLKELHLTIVIGQDNFIQIYSGNHAFNHYAAIKYMEKIGLIREMNYTNNYNK